MKDNRAIKKQLEKEELLEDLLDFKTLKSQEKDAISEAWVKFKKQALKKEKGDITLTSHEAQGFLTKRAKRGI